MFNMKPGESWLTGQVESVYGWSLEKSMIDPITERIKAELSRIEDAEQVSILYACESGSRAWGFESDDSDYVLRPVFACNWIEQGYGVVPIEFGKLVDRIVGDAELRTEIEGLLQAKRRGAELHRGPKNPVISGFLERELERLQAKTQAPPKTKDPGTLDRLFVDILKEVNGESIEPDPAADQPSPIDEP